jgi:hypothetical protein
VPWDRPFTEPIELPKGKKLVTFRDAALYITKLPKAEHDAPQFAVQPTLARVNMVGGGTFDENVMAVWALEQMCFGARVFR